MEEETLKNIDKKLDAIVRLLASSCIQGKSKTEAIITLGALGMDANIIAEIVGTTSGTVNVRLSEHRRKSQGLNKRTKEAKRGSESQ